MALTDQTKINYSWKKWSNRQHTTNDKAWYEEFPGKSFYVSSNEVWVDDIPSTPPASSTSIVEVYDTLQLTLDNTVSNNRSWLACSTPGDTTTRIRGFIPPKFGSGYAARIFDNNGNEIPSSHPSNWFFDYENGIVVFENSPSSYGITFPIYLKAYRYVGNTLTNNNNTNITKRVIDYMFIPYYYQVNLLDPLIRKYLAKTQIQETTTYYVDHYGNFKWQVVGEVSGEAPETTISNESELINYIVNNVQNDGSKFLENATLYLYAYVDNSLPYPAGLFGYNMFFTYFKAGVNYYTKVDVCPAFHTPQTKQFIVDLYSWYLGEDISTLSEQEIRTLLWLPKNYAKYYRPALMGTEFYYYSNTASSGSRKIYDTQTHSLSTTSGTASIVDVIYAGGRFGYHSIRRNLKTLLTDPQSFWSVIAVYVVKDGYKYAFYIKPIGMDHFKIPFDYRIGDTFEIYAIVSYTSKDLGERYIPLSSLMGSFDCHENDYAHGCKYLITRTAILDHLHQIDFKWKDKQLEIRFAYEDPKNPGVLSPLSKQKITGVSNRYGFNIWMLRNE